MNIRAALVPVASLGSNIAPLLIMVGFGLSAAGIFSTIFLNIGIALFLGVVLFHVVTLPKCQNRLSQLRVHEPWILLSESCMCSLETRTTPNEV